MFEHFPNTRINIRRVGHVLLVILSKLHHHSVDDLIGGVSSNEFPKQGMGAAPDSALEFRFGMLREAELNQCPIHLRDDVALGIDQCAVQIKEQGLDFHSVDTIRDSNPEKARL